MRFSKALPGRKEIGIILLAAALSLSLFFGISFSQNLTPSQSLEVSPPSQEVKANPGQTISVKTKVRNASRSTTPIKVRVEDFTASGEEGQVALVETPYSLVSWTRISPETFSLSPGQQKEVTATISVPQDAAGGRYGSFVFSIAEPDSKPGTAGVAQELASLFLVRISGPVSENLSLTEFTAPSFSESAPIIFSMKFENKGNIHLKPNGLINVRNIFGQTQKDVVFRGENVFPQATRSQKAVLDNEFLIGPFTAQAVLYYGGKNETLTATTSFFVFPARLAAAILLILYVLYIFRRRLGKALGALAGR